MPALRRVLAWLLTAALVVAPPMGVAAHGSFGGSHSHVGMHHADRDHDGMDHDDTHDAGTHEDNDRPAQPYHDQSVADHSHQTAGLVRDQTMQRPALGRQWRLASDPELAFDSTFRLERPPRS